MDNRMWTVLLLAGALGACTPPKTESSASEAQESAADTAVQADAVVNPAAEVPADAAAMANGAADAAPAADAAAAPAGQPEWPPKK